MDADKRARAVDRMATMVAVLQLLADASRKGQKQGEMPCPKCGSTLKWWRHSGRSAGGKCETPNCVEFLS